MSFPLRRITPEELPLRPITEEEVMLNCYHDCLAAEQTFNQASKAAETYLRETEFNSGFNPFIYRKLYKDALEQHMIAIAIAELRRDKALELIDKERKKAHLRAGRQVRVL
jgi:hypothetical protein